MITQATSTLAEVMAERDALRELVLALEGRVSSLSAGNSYLTAQLAETKALLDAANANAERTPPPNSESSHVSRVGGAGATPEASHPVNAASPQASAADGGTPSGSADENRELKRTQSASGKRFKLSNLGRSLRVLGAVSSGSNSARGLAAGLASSASFRGPAKGISRADSIPEDNPVENGAGAAQFPANGRSGQLQRLTTNSRVADGPEGSRASARNVSNSNSQVGITLGQLSFLKSVPLFHSFSGKLLLYYVGFSRLRQ